MNYIIRFAFLAFVARVANAFTCYSVEWVEGDANQTDSSALPANAQKVECKTMCEKVYSLRLHIDKTDGTYEWYAGYSWGCANYEGKYSQMQPACGEDFELSIGRKEVEGGGIFYFTRSCTCCGPDCNDKTMDDRCNADAEKPRTAFTHKCRYGGASSTRKDEPADHVIPNHPLFLPCTDSQVCLKASSVFPPSLSSYEWACATPPKKEKCGWSSYKKFSENHIEKICTCCGKECNGHEMDDIVYTDDRCNFSPVTTSSIATTQAGGFTCYSAEWEEGDTPNTTDSSLLPATAIKVPCNTMCEKIYNLRLHVDKTDGTTEWYAGYSWGCANYEGSYSTMAPQCGDNFELSIGRKDVEGGGVFYFTRSCTCCGPDCNDETMDGRCNAPEKPRTVFTHKCRYGGASSTRISEPADPVIPNHPLFLPCTDSQVCLKASSLFPPSLSSYEWACATPPKKEKCGWTSYKKFDENHVEKICSCCGKECNDHTMDDIVVNDGSCALIPEPTTTPSGATGVVSSASKLTILALAITSVLSLA